VATRLEAALRRNIRSMRQRRGSPPDAQPSRRRRDADDAALDRAAGRGFNAAESEAT